MIDFGVVQRLCCLSSCLSDFPLLDISRGETLWCGEIAMLLFEWAGRRCLKEHFRLRASFISRRRNTCHIRHFPLPSVGNLKRSTININTCSMLLTSSCINTLHIYFRGTRLFVHYCIHRQRHFEKSVYFCIHM